MNDFYYESTKNKKQYNHMDRYFKKKFISFSESPDNITPSAQNEYLVYSSKNAERQIIRINKNFHQNLLFLLENLLSNSESDNLIKSIETLSPSSISWEYPEDYRKCKREIAFCHELSFILWNRIVSHFKWEDLQNIAPFGFDQEGTWLMDSVNPCFRFTKYQIGDFFQKHMDGCHVENNDYRSILTLMIYLNDDFKGGETIFYENENNVTIEPKKGMGVIFNHDIFHEAKPLSIEEKYKYILRTDIMFKRKILKINYQNFNIFDNFNLDLYKNPDYIISEKLFYKSVNFQRNNNPKLSTEMYLEGQKKLAMYRSFRGKKWSKLQNKVEDKDSNKFIMSILSKNIYLFRIQEYLFDTQFLEDALLENTLENSLDFENYYNSNWPSLKQLKKEKLDQILNYRLVCKNFHKYFSCNILWKKILEQNFYKKNQELSNNNQDGINFLKLENYPNDTHYFEDFKLKSLQLKSKLRSFIDIGNDFIRIMFNQPILREKKFLKNLKSPFENYTGKCKSLINYHQGHLWNCNSGFGVTIGEDPSYISTSYMYTPVKCFQNELNYSYHISNVLKYISQMNHCNTFIFSLPYFMFEDFEYILEKNFKNSSKDLNEFNNEVFNKSLKIDYFQNLKEISKNKDELIGVTNFNIKYINFHSFIKNFNYDDSFLQKEYKKRLLLSIDCPKPQLFYDLNSRNEILDNILNCICREKLFVLSDKVENAIVIFLDGDISTFTYFQNFILRREYCFQFKLEDVSNRNPEFNKKLIQEYKKIINSLKIKNILKLNIIQVHEDIKNDLILPQLLKDYSENIDLNLKSYHYDHIYKFMANFII